MEMHIVLVIDQFDTLNNGTTASARRYAEELRKRGHRVTVLAAGESREDKIGVPVLKIPFFQRLIEQQGFPLAKAVDEAYYEAFRQADIVHFYLPTWFCRRGEDIARQMKIPTVAAFHLQPENITYSIGLGKCKWASDFLYRYFYRTFYNRFDHIHCPSEFIADQLKNHGYKAQFWVISNGVSEKFQPKPVERPPIFRDKFVILMIGRLSGEKRQDLLIRAAMYSKYRDRIQLVFAGRGPKEKAYRRFGRHLPNEPIFRFYPQDELVDLINACDLYVHASEAEIEGISCLEAMACGLVPVISDSELSAAKSFALHEYSLFRAGDARSLAERLDFWIEHPELKAELSVRYALRAAEMRVGRSVAATEELYRKAIKDYRLHGSRRREESLLRRITHPDVNEIHADYWPASPVKRLLFTLFTNCLAVLAYIVDSVFFGLRIEGRKNLRHLKGGAVTVINHIHPMDCTMVKLAVFPRRIYFTTLRRNLELPFIGWLIRLCGAIPLPTEPRKLISFLKQLQYGPKRGELI
ncbi:MAG: glycosyltransferase, partial [Firmicutes bacterium]|nr:glycosyltransferase [Bacillota bacterium]